MSENKKFIEQQVDMLSVRGSERVELLHRLSTNDLLKLKEEGHKVSTVFTSAQGKIVDWVIALSTGDELLLKLSPGRANDLSNWINQFIIMEDVQIENVTAQWASYVVDGAFELQKMGISQSGDGQEIWPFDEGFCIRGDTSYSARHEVFMKRNFADAWKDKLQAAGYIEAGDSFLEESRIRAGVPSPHFEFDEEINPLELRLKEQVISWTKGCYIGQEVISRLDSYDKLARILIGFECGEKIPEDKSMRLRKDGKSLGRVTSRHILADGSTIGLAIVKRAEAKPGPVELSGDFGTLEVNLCDRPFWSEV
tara:strand:- start:227 stop:1156 length:930 start_codon:yes stop_codon:yes gene_type:complete